jgi:hypothetical protein
MDFGFIQASTFDYRHPCPGVNWVVECFEGFTAYLIIVNKASQYIWVFLRKSKEPPTNLVLNFLALHGLPSGGVIRTDLGGELARSESFWSSLLQKAWYIVEPPGADSPLQNGGAEKWNHTLAVTTRSLLYGSGLPAWYWSAALLHAAYLHNQRVHCATKMTPFESWFQQQPNLKHLRIFGLCVCVKQSGKRRAKLDQHHFDGIFIGYTATDHNIRYIDIVSSIVKHSYHAVFDEAWYLQPSRPPAAQLLYDLGLQDDTLPTASQPATDTIVTLLPPCPKKYPDPPPIGSACHLHLPLRESATPNLVIARAATTRIPDPYHNTMIRFNWDAAAVNDYQIQLWDVAQIFMSPSPYNDAFEEYIDMK